VRLISGTFDSGVLTSNKNSIPLLTHKHKAHGAQHANAERDAKVCLYFSDSCMGPEQGGNGEAGEYKA
jgi:hypothetical protein